MPLRVPTRPALAAAVLLPAAVASTAAGQGYTFTNIADTTNPQFAGVESFDYASINNSGQVLFGTGPYASANLYFASDGMITTVAASGGQFDLVSEVGYLNDAGTVAFNAGTGGVGGTFTWNGGTIEPVAGTGPGGLADAYVMGINNAGTVLLGSYDSGNHGLHTASGGVITPVVIDGPDDNYDASDISPFYFAALNDAGAVAFTARTPDGFSAAYRVLPGQEPAAVATASTQGGGFYPSYLVDINNAGTVAYRYYRNEYFDNGIVTVAVDGTQMIVADTETGTEHMFLYDYVSINEAGTVAFKGIAFYGGNGYYAVDGIFTGPDTIADRVIAQYDELFGSNVYRLEIFQHSLNDRGEVVFSYVLDNGVSGIAVASPVPEPAAASLLAIAGLIGLRRRR